MNPESNDETKKFKDCNIGDKAYLCLRTGSFRESCKLITYTVEYKHVVNNNFYVFLTEDGNDDPTSTLFISDYNYNNLNLRYDVLYNLFFDKEEAINSILEIKKDLNTVIDKYKHGVVECNNAIEKIKST